MNNLEEEYMMYNWKERDYHSVRKICKICVLLYFLFIFTDEILRNKQRLDR